MKQIRVNALKHEYIFFEIFSNFKYFTNILSMLHEEQFS